MNSFDLIVVGAGIVGAACADYASAQGLSVAIVESGTIGGGTTAAAMGHLVAVDGAPAELALAHYSLGLWEAFADLPQAEFSRCGTLWVASDESECARIPDKLARLAAAGVHGEALDAGHLYELEPALAPGLGGGVLVSTESVVYPPGVARYLVDRARQQGAKLFQHRASLAADGGVALSDSTRLHGPVLVATGSVLPELLPMLPLRLRKGHLVITDRYPGVIHHQLLELHYADSAHGDADASVAFNVQPRPTGQLLIGSSREFGQSGAEVSMPIVRRMLDRALQFLPVMRDMQALRIWTGFRPDSIDGLPYIGRVRTRPDVWVAAGHEGLGVTTSLGSARLLIDQFLGRQPELDASPYDPARAVA
ncbi:MAG: FAD-dependent oxidoreductase [Rhodanobacter sp.]